MKNLKLIDYIHAALFAALLAVTAYIRIPLPFSPVPITGQTLAVMLAGSILKPRQAALSVITFLLIGLVGIPVFAGKYHAGIGALTGPTGGYLIGFLVGVILISLIKGKDGRPHLLFLGNFLGGILVIYLLGFTWQSIVTKVSFMTVVLGGSLWYLPGDIIKVIAATFIATSVNKQLPYLSNNS